MYIGRKIKSWDFFGTPVSLKFRDEGDSFNTITGGLISVILRAAMLYYLYDEMKKEFKPLSGIMTLNKENIDKIVKILANFGGLFVALKIIVGFFIEPISQFTYLLVLVPDLFRVKS